MFEEIKNIKTGKKYIRSFGITFGIIFLIITFYLFCLENESYQIIFYLSVSFIAFGLILQPDIGQTILITLAASIIYFISGMPLIVGFTIFILSLIGIGLSYLYVDHFYQRLNIFFNPQFVFL